MVQPLILAFHDTHLVLQHPPSLDDVRRAGLEYFLIENIFLFLLACVCVLHFGVSFALGLLAVPVAVAILVLLLVLLLPLQVVEIFKG